VAEPLDTRAQNALALLSEVRRAFSLPPCAAGALGASGLQELLEAEPLLTMLAMRVRAAPGPASQDDVRQAWNKAVRRRGWTHLPSLEPAPRLVTERPPSASEDPLQLVAAFLASFGVQLDARAVSQQSLSLAHVLCGVLIVELDALRALPLPSPEEYAIRYHALVARWNELARRAPDLPRLPQAEAGPIT
jgi:hypothetical protein